MAESDAAVVVAVNQDRERQALERAASYKAQALAEFERSDPDDLSGDVRRAVYGHLTACADLFERYADECRERWVSARSDWRSYGGRTGAA